MFENLLIVIAVTVVGWALMSMVSQPMWHGACSPVICESRIVTI